MEKNMFSFVKKGNVRLDNIEEQMFEVGAW
jgi:hypothetical protein